MEAAVLVIAVGRGRAARHAHGPQLPMCRLVLQKSTFVAHLFVAVLASRRSVIITASELGQHCARVVLIALLPLHFNRVARGTGVDGICRGSCVASDVAAILRAS